MPYPIWPVELPQFPFTPETPPEYKPQSNVKRTDMQTGPAKVRRKATGRVEDLTIGPIDLNQAQLDRLEDFVTNDLGEAKPFLWFNFRRKSRDKVEALYRFPQGWASVTTKYKGIDNFSVEWHEVSIQLEMLPWA